MENIVVLYVNDSTDPYISQYLYEDYVGPDVKIEYSERKFEVEDSYETLLKDYKVHAADIIIIDSVLFENASFSSEKLTGEEFEIILKQVFPYKEVIVVSQNDIDQDVAIIKKYDTSLRESNQDFFQKNWKPILDKSVNKVKLNRKMLKRIKDKNYVEPYFLEEIQQSLIGEVGYRKLTVDDIDTLINKFESVINEYDK